MSSLRPSSTEVSLERMATSLAHLVKLQADAQATPDAEIIVNWLSTLDHGELNDEVMRRQTLGTPVMWIVLEVLSEWASGS